MKTAIRYTLSFPSDLVCWLILAFIRVVWGSESEWKDGVWWVRLSEKSWPANTWFEKWGATTFGHGVMVSHKDHNWRGEGLRAHELVHVEQYEQESVQGAIIFVMMASTPWWWTGLIWWSIGGLLEMFTGFITAWLRGEKAYRGSHLEEAARAHGKSDD